MDHLSMLILGAVQGAAEFLPISSSGHLALAKSLLKGDADIAAFSAAPLLLDILLHAATLAAVLVFFRKQIKEAIRGGLVLLQSIGRGTVKDTLASNDGAMTALCVIIASFPTAVSGLLLKGAAEMIGASLMLLGASFFCCAGILFLSRFRQGGEKRLTPLLGLIIGIAQGIAVLPGISRSGVTIAVALALGAGRKEAVSFSFLLSIPAILGAALLEIDSAQLALCDNIAGLASGAVTAFAVGFGALYFLDKIVDKGRLWWFAPYVTAVGIFCAVAEV
jgi:undecaprenyl-diphosphatase